MGVGYLNLVFVCARTDIRKFARHIFSKSKEFILVLDEKGRSIQILQVIGDVHFIFILNTNETTIILQPV